MSIRGPKPVMNDHLYYGPDQGDVTAEVPTPDHPLPSAMPHNQHADTTRHFNAIEPPPATPPPTDKGNVSATPPGGGRRSPSQIEPRPVSNRVPIRSGRKRRGGAAY